MTRAASFLRLVRASIALSAAADAVAGVAIAAASGVAVPAVAWWLTPLISLCLFAFGMSQNDLADREKDAAGRGGDRPIPSGAIGVGAARAVVFGTAATALALAAAMGLTTALATAGLIASISLYNLSPRHLGGLGPVVLGAIRAQNLMLGGVAAGAVSAVAPAAIAYAIYIGAVSVAARMEDGEIRPTVARLTGAIRVAQIAALVAPFTIAPPRSAAPALVIAAYLLVRIELALRAAIRDGLSAGPSIPRLIGACLSGIFLFDAGLSLAVGSAPIALGLVGLFALSRALVRRFPPS